MTRSLDTAIINELATLSIKTVFLFEGQWESGFLRLTTAVKDIVYNGNTFIAQGHLLAFDGLEETIKFETNTATVTLGGLVDAVKALALEEQFTNNPAKIYIAFLDENDNIIHEPYLAFEGLMDGMEMVDDFDSKTATISVPITSHFARFEQTNGRKTNPTEHRAKYPNDSFFDSVPKLSEQIYRINW